jgi:hypothetical protein
MTGRPLEAYLASVRPDAREAVRVLAAAIEAAEAGFQVRFTYGMLVWTFGGRWHDWVVGISVAKRAVNLRFLYGQQLDDPSGRMRPGSTTAGTIDYASEADIDPATVTALVRQAVERHPGRS